MGWARSIARSLLGALEVSQKLSLYSRSPSGSSWRRSGCYLPPPLFLRSTPIGIRFAKGLCFHRLTSRCCCGSQLLAGQTGYAPSCSSSMADSLLDRTAVFVARKQFGSTFPSSIQSSHAERTTRRSKSGAGSLTSRCC